MGFCGFWLEEAKPRVVNPSVHAYHHTTTSSSVALLLILNRLHSVQQKENTKSPSLGTFVAANEEVNSKLSQRHIVQATEVEITSAFYLVFRVERNCPRNKIEVLATSTPSRVIASSVNN